MPGECTDGDVIAGIGDIRQVRQPADVDQDCGHREPESHQGQQRMPACEELCFVAVFAEERNGLLDRSRSHVLERCRDHRDPPPASAAARTAFTML
jgi:hypothetical protein